MPQWDASLRFDQRDALRTVRAPVHVIAFAEDVQAAPPQDGEEFARLSPPPGSTCWKAWATAPGTATRTSGSTR
jgi:hypothetical protein